MHIQAQINEFLTPETFLSDLWTRETCQYQTIECRWQMFSDVNAELNKALMKNPEVLAAVQDHLMVQSPADYIKS